MGALLIVKTKTEEPDVQLYQGGLDELKSILHTEPDVWDLRTKVYGLRPDPNSSRCIRGAFRLECVYTEHNRSAAEAHMQEALYYARVDGNKQESDVLKGFLALVHHHWKEACEREARVRAKPEERVAEIPQVQPEAANVLTEEPDDDNDDPPFGFDKMTDTF